MSGRSVHLSAFACNRQKPFLNQRKEGEWPLKLFHDQSPCKYVTGRICSQTRYRLLFAARSKYDNKVILHMK